MVEQDYVSSREAKWNLPSWETRDGAQLRIIKGEDQNTYHLRYQLPEELKILHEGTEMPSSDVLYHGLFNNPKTHHTLRHISLFSSLMDMLDQVPEDVTLVAGPGEDSFEGSDNRYVSKLNFMYHFVTTERNGEVSTETVRLQLDPIESVLTGLSLNPEGIYLKIKTENGDRNFPIYKPQIGFKRDQIELKDTEKGWGTEFRVIVRDESNKEHGTLFVNKKRIGKVVDWGTLDEYDSLVRR